MGPGEDCEPTVDLVLSGPSSSAVSARATEQVLLEIVGGAQEELWLATYNLNMYPGLRAALHRALEQGVMVYVLAEDAKPGFNPAAGVGGLAVKRLLWPQENRTASSAAMQAKIAAADHAVALVTSANLSESAANHSMESGLLIRGGSVPRQLTEHLECLLFDGTLRTA
jgi:phosphatidylserine/phosphatidylglycerophosphate/cardiolipin synthase-like enzyme